MPPRPASRPASARRADPTRTIPRATAVLRRRGRDLAGALLAALGAAAVAAAHYQVWTSSPGVPLTYGGDSLLFEAWVRTVLDGEWYYRIPRLGYPFGLDQVDRPVSDHVQLALAKVLGWIVGADPGRVANLLLFVSFPLVAATAFAALRWLRVSRSSAVVAAVLFAVTPDHFLRGTGHLFYAVPVVVPLAVAALARQAVGIPAGRGNRLPFVVVALLAFTGVYWAVFLIAASLLLALLQLVGGERRMAASTALLGASCLLALVVALSPALLGGTRPGVGYNRSYLDSETYGLRIDRLLLPGAGHRLAFLHGPADRMAADGIEGIDATAPLGIVGAVGLVSGVILVLRRRRVVTDPRSHDPVALATAAGLVSVLLVLLAVPGGLGGLASSLGFAQIRAWNRVAMFLAFAALTVVALLADHVLRGRRLVMRVGILAVVAVLGIVDQVPRFDLDARRADVARYTADRGFFTALEAALPTGTPVLQLPAVPFPENPPVFGLSDYEHLRGYLLTDDLRWSYGAAKSRVPPWDAELACQRADELVAGAVLVGFGAVYVDLAGWAPEDAGAIEPTFRRVLGAPLLRSGDGRLLVWDLAEIAVDLPTAAAALALDDAALASLRDDVLAGVATTDTDLGPLAEALGLPSVAPLPPCGPET